MRTCDDLTGKKFGKLTVVKNTGEKRNTSYVWICKCDCGREKAATARDLNSGRVTSCGCEKGFRRHLEGCRFGKLEVIKDSGKKQNHKTMWLCKCDCGNICKVRTDSLTSGNVISCGCVANGPDKIKTLTESRNLSDHTSNIFFKGTVSKNNTTGSNGVSKLKNGKYRASIGYKNKVYSLVEDYDIEVARSARMDAEEAVKNGNFDEWIANRRNRK